MISYIQLNQADIRIMSISIFHKDHLYVDTYIIKIAVQAPWLMNEMIIHSLW